MYTHLLCALIWFPVIIKYIIQFSLHKILAVVVVGLYTSFAYFNAYTRYVINRNSGFRLVLNTMLQAVSCMEHKKLTISNLLEYMVLPGLLLLYVVAALAVFGPSLALPLWLWRLDPFTTILKDYGLVIPPTLHWSHPTYLLHNACIIISQIFVLSSHFRDLLVLLFIAVWTTSSFKVYLMAIRGLLKHSDGYPTRKTTSLMLRQYTQLRIPFSASSEDFVSFAMSLVLFSQVLLTWLIWITINCFQFAPPFFVAFCAVGFFIGLFVTLYLMNMGAVARLESFELIRTMKNSFGILIPGEKMSRHAYLRRCWTAQQPLPINCGHHFAFTKDTVLNYLVVLNTNATNAILLLRL